MTDSGVEVYSVGYVAGGRYEIVKTIGSGAMGSVHEAFDRLIKKRVAVKFLSPDLVSDAGTAKRFQREAQAAGQIRHDNVCDVSDLGVTEDGTPFLVMELLDGEPFDDRLWRQGKLSPQRAVEIALQVLAALGAAHDLGIVHRDLKPGNVLLFHGSDGREKVKLIDFGIAKFLDAAGTMAVTATGIVVGTPYYMSPEQARGDSSEIDHRSDLWAMGVMLYETLTGEMPFEGDNYQEIFAGILFEDPIPPRKREPELPPAIEEVVLKALSKEKEHRYSSASEMAGALIEAMDGEVAAPAGLEDTDRDDKTPCDSAEPDIALDDTRLSQSPKASEPESSAPSRPPSPPAESEASVSPEDSLSFTEMTDAGVRSRWMLPALLVVVLMVLGGGIAALLARHRDEGAASSEPSQTGPTDTAAPEPTASPALSSPASGTESLDDTMTENLSHIEVLLEEVPRGATVRFDDVDIRDGVLRGLEDSSGLLEVQAEGFLPLQERITLEAGVRINLGQRLVRREKAPREDHSRPVHRRVRDRRTDDALNESLRSGRPAAQAEEGRGPVPPLHRPANAPRIVGGWEE